MSYTTTLFAVDLEELRRIVREHDVSVLERVQAAQPDQFEHQLNNGDPSLGEALRQIIAGDVRGAPPSHQYGYALKLLCQVEGAWLPDDDLIADLEPLELHSPLEQARLPVDVPANHDFPFISFLVASEVRREAERLAALDLSYPDDEDIQEAREAYAACIAQAAKAGKAVISFYS
ncbi:MAG: hypothetical protein K0Q72_1101 [Armatimonadetes bacterium]|jgi:hypothetical protein|nr:hypothetical protein [Armatimonadota bacterium]